MWLLLQKEVAHELDENKAEQDRLQGSNLVYGERIQVSETQCLKVIYCMVNCSINMDVIFFFFFSKAVSHRKQEIFGSEHNQDFQNWEHKLES